MKLRQHFLLLFVVLTGTLYGQSDQVLSKEVNNKVYFRLGEKQLDLIYKDNGKSLDALIKSLNALTSDTSYVMSKLKIVGIASPDGVSEATNIALAESRAEAIKAYIAPRLNMPSSRIVIENNGENWAGLRGLVAASQMPGKTEVLRILDTVKDRDSRKDQLMALQGGVPYKYMLQRLFPGLRCGFSISSTYSSVKAINQRNWILLQKELSSCVLSETEKESLLNIFSHSTNSDKSFSQMQNLIGGKTFEKVKSNFFSKVLFASDSTNTNVNNWLLLEKIVASSSDIPYKQDILRLFADVPVSEGREDKLKALHEGVCYQYMMEHFFSRLLQRGSTADSSESLTSQSEGSWRHLRYLVGTSTMETKVKYRVLEAIDHNADPSARVEALLKIDGGTTYRTLCDQYLPALLYDPRTKSQDMSGFIKREVTGNGMPESEKGEVLSLVGETPLPADRDARLRALHSGATYHNIQDGLLLSLLTGGDTASVKRLSDLARERQTLDKAQSPQKTVTDSVSLRELPPRWALKTNLLYDGILMPNLEIEYMLSACWSVNIEGQYAWWSRPEKSQFYQIASVSPELRYWLSHKEPFSGHYVGVYYGGGLYDLEDGNSTGYYGACYISTGLSYGYMKSLGPHLSLELGIGAGYLSTGYKTYFPIDGRYVYQSTRRLNYVGPTKAKISLVWKFSRKVKGRKEME
jgi:hypothetical protein